MAINWNTFAYIMNIYVTQIVILKISKTETLEILASIFKSTDLVIYLNMNRKKHVNFDFSLLIEN